MDKRNEIGIRIRNLRKRDRLTQETLAEKIGVSSQATSNWEKGRSLPGMDNIIAIAELFKVPVSYLVGDADMQAPASLGALSLSEVAGILEKARLCAGSIPENDRAILEKMFLMCAEALHNGE